MSPEAFGLVRDNTIAKGDVLRVAEVAGTMGGKRTAELIPLCHPLPLDALRVECAAEESIPGVRVTATASVTARTGVEMEALTAVGVACLTLDTLRPQSWGPDGETTYRRRRAVPSAAARGGSLWGCFH